MDQERNTPELEGAFSTRTDIIYDIGLNLFCAQFRDPEAVLATAGEAGIKCILTGSDMDEDLQIDAFVRTHDTYGTAGIHPHNADGASDADFETLRRILTENARIVAVGECGLDFDRNYSTRDNQIACLTRHIELSEETGKPMFLHERKASDTLVSLFRDHPEVCRRAVVHCFTGTRAELLRYLEMGFMISITGWICDDRRAEALRDAVSVLPPDRVMIETDAPYLTPRNVPGLDRVNVPWNLPYVLNTLAGYMGMDKEKLAQYTKVNTERFFGIPVRKYNKIQMNSDR